MSSQTVGGLLHERAAATPTDRFLWCAGEWLTYVETVAASDRLAAGLQGLGVAPGDRVAVILPNEQSAVLAVYACARLGAIQVPLNTFLRGQFLRYQLADCQASVVLTDDLGFEELRTLVGELPDLRHVVLVGGRDGIDRSSFPLPVTLFDDLVAGAPAGEFPIVAPESTFSILYTSGTTGMPKGCLIPHRYATHVGQTLCEVGRFDPGDAVLTASPLFHTSGQIFAMVSALHAGGSIAYEREFHASTFINRADELGSTVIFGVGAMGLLILAQPERETDRQHQVRLGIFNGMPIEAQLAIEERFGFHVVGEMFGHTEFVPMSASHVNGPRKRASGGQLLPHVEVRIVDDDDLPVPVGEPGEIVARPLRPGVMFDGYWNNPQATVEMRRNLWHHTGDIGRVDEDGFLTFVDRKKDAIRRRGEFIVARELEGAILEHPDIAAVAAHAVASDVVEDEIRVWVVPALGAVLSAEKLFAFFKDKLPYFAMPRYIDVVDDLPTNQSARVMKHELKERPIGPDTWDLQALGLVVRRDERRGVVPTA